MKTQFYLPGNMQYQFLTRVQGRLYAGLAHRSHYQQLIVTLLSSLHFEFLLKIITEKSSSSRIVRYLYIVYKTIDCVVFIVFCHPQIVFSHFGTSLSYKLQTFDVLNISTARVKAKNNRKRNVQSLAASFFARYQASQPQVSMYVCYLQQGGVFFG